MVSRTVAVVAVVLLAGAVGVGAEFVLPEGASVGDVNASVTVNDGGIPDAPLGDDGTARCTMVGPPPGSVSVRTAFTIVTPVERFDLDDEYRVVVSLSELSATKERTVDVSTTRRLRVLTTFENEGKLSPGDRATVEIRVRDGGATVARATRTVTAERGGQVVDCE